MKFPRFLVLFGVLAAGNLLAANAPVPAATTNKKTAIVLEHGSVSLPKGTRVEVLGVEGDQLLVKFRAARGRLPLADTDYVAPKAPLLPPAVTTPVKSAIAPVKPPPPTALPTAVKPQVAPPALNTSDSGQQPATNYGKAVQKAKQAAEAHTSSHVDPTKDILDGKN